MTDPKTIRIQHPTEPWMNINESDFDPTIHARWVEPEQKGPEGERHGDKLPVIPPVPPKPSK